MNKPTGKQKTALVSKFVKKSDNIIWSKEMKTAERLLKIEPFDFWMHVVLGFELNSLCYFLSEAGKKELQKHKIIYQKYLQAVEKERVEKPKLDFSKKFIPSSKKDKKLKKLDDLLDE